MSKRDLKKYLGQLEKDQIAEQLIALYDKFPEVKTYYDFVFNPNEEKLIAAAKAKISNEYFPIKSKRAKLRRSTAQKYIKHYLTLGVDPIAMVDLMLFNIEVAQRFSAKREMRYSSFYKSIVNSFGQATTYAAENGILRDFSDKFKSVFYEAVRQGWENKSEFELILDQHELL